MCITMDYVKNMTANQQTKNSPSTAARNVATAAYGVITIEPNIPVPLKSGKHKSKDGSKYAELNSILNSLKVGESFTLQVANAEAAACIMSQLFTFGVKVKRTFVSRTLPHVRGGLELEKPAKRSLRVWRTRYTTPKRKPKRNKRSNIKLPRPIIEMGII